MFYQDILLVIVKISCVIMLLLSWCFIKTYHVSLSRIILYLSWCSCYHGYFIKTSLVIDNESLVIVMKLLLAWCFFKTNHLSLSRNRLISCNCHYASVVMMFYQGISLVIVKDYLVFVMMLLLPWCLSRHIACHWEGITCFLSCLLYLSWCFCCMVIHLDISLVMASVCELGFNVTFNNFSVISWRCLVVTGSSMLTFLVLPHWSIMSWFVLKKHHANRSFMTITRDSLSMTSDVLIKYPW